MTRLFREVRLYRLQAMINVLRGRPTMYKMVFQIPLPDGWYLIDEGNDSRSVMPLGSNKNAVIISCHFNNPDGDLDTWPSIKDKLDNDPDKIYKGSSHPYIPDLPPVHKPLRKRSKR